MSHFRESRFTVHTDISHIFLIPILFLNLSSQFSNIQGLFPSESRKKKCFGEGVGEERDTKYRILKTKLNLAITYSEFNIAF